VAKPPFGGWKPAKAGFAACSRGFSRRGQEPHPIKTTLLKY